MADKLKHVKFGSTLPDGALLSVESTNDDYRSYAHVCVKEYDSDGLLKEDGEFVLALSQAKELHVWLSQFIEIAKTDGKTMEECRAAKITAKMTEIANALVAMPDDRLADIIKMLGVAL
jgi:hypothetical protein